MKTEATVSGEAGAASGWGVRERLRRLEAVTDVELSKLSLEDLLNEVLVRVREMLAGDTAAVLLLDDARQFLTAVAATGLEEEVHQGVRIPVGRGFAGRVAAEARPVVIDHVSSANVINPILLRRNVRSVVGVPLLDGQSVIGVLHVGTLRPRVFGDADISLLQLAAERVASAVIGRRAYLDRAAATSLQRSLAPRQLPSIPGFELAARYVPGSQYGVSGDWYDVFPLPSGAVGVVIGDVMGHGLRAATVMGRLRSALRAYSLEHADPGTVLAHLDRKIQHFEPGQMGTVFYGVLDVNSAELTFSSAGHLPPALSCAGAVATILELPVGLPLGVDLTMHRPVHRITLEPGAVLCLLTDGLIDQRTGDIDAGLRLVRDTLSAGADGAESTCAQLMTALIGERSAEDDVTLLVLRRDPVIP
ncbi:MAG TPA: GAF domain-containing SpoIIE family protein phosphatase [Jatrophihabitantaceae bacterium]|nr:GAF domain-containing SpoIIE family protein phosphatase [Jatrophihabitantaceae bacterium]